MKVSLNVMQRYANVDLKTLPTDELVKLATERLGGVEGVTDLSKHYEGIVVAKIVSCIKHPNADKLSLCKIDDNNTIKNVARDENGYVQVVCGAPNVKEGLLVAWIPPEAVVPASYGEKELFVLEARDLRGQLSNGMLASPAELGINDDHTGILEIPSELPTIDRSPLTVHPGEGSEQKTENARKTVDSTPKTVLPGMPFKNLYDLDDTILEIENKMFTHRPDCFGHLGVAREIAGIQHLSFQSPNWYLQPQLPVQKPNINITIEDPKLSKRYMAVEFQNVSVKPSPLWLQSYLKRIGVRPINNIVDITNYIMVLTAQPIHAFDFDKIAQKGIVDIAVRRPKKNEKLTLLDGKEIEPHSEATLICGSGDPIALGGVMGGQNSEIDEKTSRVVLECATFDMYNIRKTSMIHGLFTDAATRFTKGQPAEQLPSVLAKAITMFEELASAKVIGVADEYPTQDSRLTKHDYIEIETKFINERLGSKFSSEEVVALLTNVEMQAHEASGPLSITPPFWRTDIEMKEDIVEEVGRLYGFNQLPNALPHRSISPVTPDPLRLLKSQIRTSLSRSGANEVLTYSFVHGNLLTKAGQDPTRAFALRNALSPDLQYYRLSLLPSLLDKVRPNIKAGYDEFVLYEIGKMHSKYPDDKPGELPAEYNNLEMVYTSAKPKPGSAYYHMLKHVDNLLSDLGVAYRLEKPDKSSQKIQAEKPFDMSRSAYLYYKNAEQGGFIGIVGELEASVIKAFKLPQYTAGAYFALDGASFAKEHRELNKYQPLSKFPTTEQDLTLKVDTTVSFQTLQTLLENELEKSDYNWKLTPLSIYQKDGDATKNISFRITLTHYERTLTTNEATKLIELLSWQAHEELNAEQV